MDEVRHPRAFLLWISGLFRSYMSQHILSLGVLGLDLGLLAFSHIFSILLANTGMRWNLIE